MARADAYRFQRTGRWNATEFLLLSSPARLLLINLETGSQSSLAGIGFFYREAAERETALTGPEVEAALGELEKTPTPAHSFIVRDRGVVWVRDFLRNDPARVGDPDIRNVKHRTSIERTLASLPRESLAVKKFRDYYKFRTHTPSRRVSVDAPASPSHGDGVTPDSYSDSNSGLRTPDSGRSDSAERPAPPPARLVGASAAPGSTGDEQDLDKGDEILAAAMKITVEEVRRRRGQAARNGAHE